MHELSIAHSLVELASDAATRAGVAHVRVLHLRLGALAGVVREALEFSFTLAAEGTPLAGTQLAIEEVPVRIYCACCQAHAELPDIQRFRCPQCGTPSSQIVQGRELELVALEYEE
jgi:hydrogenase nickel incorporation protein HypA/HybF